MTGFTMQRRLVNMANWRSEEEENREGENVWFAVRVSRDMAKDGRCRQGKFYATGWYVCDPMDSWLTSHEQQ